MELYSDVLLNSLRSVRSESVQTFDVKFLAEKDRVKRFIKERWLEGKRPDGSLIGEYHSLFYADEKYKMNSQAGFLNVDLTVTGDLGNRIDLSLVPDGIEVFSTDEKFNKIFDKYGGDNFNITDEQTETLIDEISSATVEELYLKYL